MVLGYWVAGILLVLSTQLIVAAGLAGVGLLVRRAAGLRTLATRDLLVAFWAGLAVVMLFLTAWSFGWRVSSAPLVIVMGIGTAGLVVWRRELRSLPGREPGFWSLGVLALLALAALWVANAGRGPLINTDTMLYHLQGVRWAKEFPTPPGLANLFGPLGFNNVSFLYDAMVDVGPWQGRAYHFANGVLILPLLWQGLLGLVAVARGTGSQRIQGGFDAALIGAAVNMGIQDWMRSFVTDLPSTSVVLVAAAGAHRLLLDEPEEPRAAAYEVVTVLVLLSLAVTFKVNLTVFAGLVGLIVLWRVFDLRSLTGRLRRRAVGWGVGIALLIGSLWMARGVVLSGYLLFPTSGLSLPVDWRAPKEHAIGEFGYAAESARATVERPAGILHDEPFRQWFGRWFKTSVVNQPFHVPAPASFALVAIVVFLSLRFGKKGRRDPVPSAWLLMAAAVVAAVVWFRVAPEPRYAAPLAWTAFGVSVAAGLRIGGDSLSRRAVVLALAVAGVSPAVLRPALVTEPDSRGLSPVRRVIYMNLRLPGPRALLFPPRQRPPTPTEFRTESGLVLNVVPRRCWDAPLPCTPNPAPNLRLRVPGHLEKGFAVEGPWQMENWPAGRPTFRKAWAERRQREREASSGR